MVELGFELRADWCQSPYFFTLLLGSWPFECIFSPRLYIMLNFISIRIYKLKLHIIPLFSVLTKVGQAVISEPCSGILLIFAAIE